MFSLKSVTMHGRFYLVLLTSFLEYYSMCLLCLKPASGLLRVALSGPSVRAGERGHPSSWSLAPSTDKYTCRVFSVGPGPSRHCLSCGAVHSVLPISAHEKSRATWGQWSPHLAPQPVLAALSLVQMVTSGLCPLLPLSHTWVVWTGGSPRPGLHIPADDSSNF